MTDERTCWLRFVLRWMALSAIFHLIAAFLSAGFYHSDEHFQIVEFLRLRILGGAQDLPVEYAQAIRPWLQPAIYGVILSVARTLGIDSPFHWAFLFRLFSSVLGLFASTALCLCVPRWIDDKHWQRLAVIATALLWYLPAFHARHSSENLCGSLFFLGLSAITLLPSSQGALFGTGMLWGLAFECRYQTALMILGAGAWLALVPNKKLSLQSWKSLLLGGLSAIAIGTFVDRWGYGRWTFTPWNYFRYNLLENHFARADLAPFLDFFRRALTETWPPLGFILLCAFVLAWVRHPRHLLTWVTLPMLAVHMLIPHKELRFIFPIVHAGGLLLILSAQTRKSWPTAAKIFTWALTGWNCFALIALSVTPAWMPIRFLQKVYELQPETLYFPEGADPYRILGLPIDFYRPPRLREVPLIQLSLVPDGAWLFYPRSVLPENLVDSRCKLVFKSLPLPPPESLALPKKWTENVTDWSLFRCGL